MQKPPTDPKAAKPSPTPAAPRGTWWMRDGPNPAKAHTPVSPSPFSAPGTEPGHDRQKEYGQIHERNGIWVVTIGGIWRGDYTRRENAIAAVKAASLDAW